MKNKSDLINYLYIIILDIKDFDLKTKLPIRYTKIINVFIYLFKFYVHMRPCGYDRRPVTILAMMSSVTVG